MLPVSIIISCLFILMLACLGGMVCSLQQQSPARTTSGNRAHSESPLKRRAVGNVLVVVAPTVISYLPVLGMVFLYLFLYNTNIFVNQIICNVFEFSIIFPKFGVLIGPLFYLSKARQMCWVSRTGGKFDEKRHGAKIRIVILALISLNIKWNSFLFFVISEHRKQNF